MLKDVVQHAVEQALNTMGVSDAAVEITATDKPEFGDYATNVAFTLSKQLQKPPREIADDILANLDTNAFEKVEVAGPGFLNFYLKLSTVQSVIHAAMEQGAEFGRPSLGKSKRIQVEYVSANPTGPLTVGHARNAVVGDTVANILAAVDYDVTREYYFNNAGRQMRVLGETVKLRVQELLGETVEIPEDYYQGEYLVEIAQSIVDEHGASVVDPALR